jgi:hypothetical protein
MDFLFPGLICKCREKESLGPIKFAHMSDLYLKRLHMNSVYIRESIIATAKGLISLLSFNNNGERTASASEYVSKMHSVLTLVELFSSVVYFM